jgi:hypothetical protein
MTAKATNPSIAHTTTGEEFHMDVSYRMSTVARSVTLKRIVSGGQTGVDRGALDAALVSVFECRGWAPGDRMAEDGIIAADSFRLAKSSTDISQEVSHMPAKADT